MKMTPREKVLAAIEHRGSGKIPFTLAVQNAQVVHGQKLLDLLKKYPCDFFDSASTTIPEDFYSRPKITTDRWGCIWETADLLIAGAVTYSPLEDWSKFESYKMPEVIKVTQKNIDAAEKRRETYPVWSGVDQFFQVMQNIRGSEKLFMDFYLQPEEVEKLIQRMLNEYHLPTLEEQLKLKPDIFGFGDDWGSQNSLLINPDLWHQYFKPVYKKIADLCHQAGTKVFFHTCGYTMEVLEGFIEAGIDIINPQMALMDAKKYGEIARNRMTICPDLNRQDILEKGSPEDVYNHITEMYDCLGTPSGGLIGYLPIEPQMPLENVEMMLKTISQYEK